MKGKNCFTMWLRLQVDRDDTVGDLARDHVRSPLPPCPRFRDIIQGIRSCPWGGRREVENAGYHAWREWRSGRATLVTRRIRRELQIRPPTYRFIGGFKIRRTLPATRRGMSNALRMRVFRRDGFQCRYCGYGR